MTFSANAAYRDLWVSVPCGTCAGCKMERARQWAVRCLHEAQLWPHSWFVTLTYNAENLPRTAAGLPTLLPSDFQRFMKRLRFEHAPRKIRFFQAGEYGELGRPHHHAILFNLPLEDLRPLHGSGSGSPLFRSAALERVWPLGFVSVGQVSVASAAYAARYTLKKVGGESAPAHYQGRVPEYVTMSRRPGIGAGWFKKFRDDVYPLDRVVTRGKPERAPVVGRPPRFYDEQLRRADPAMFERVKVVRAGKAVLTSGDEERSNRRLAAREGVLQERLSTFLRRKL